MGVKLEGEYRGDEWGAVILAQWELVEGGTVARLLVPPAAIQAIRAPKTFAKIEISAAYRLKGHARRLYAALADKKHMGQKWWEYPLDELQKLFQLEGKYSKWYDFSRYVLTPALAEINDFGTVTVKVTPKKVGRSVRSVRFDWAWKSLDDVRVTDEENARHAKARHKASDGTAPPLLDPADPSPEDKKTAADKIMREAGYRK
jgi:plasmid replication initiation protein